MQIIGSEAEIDRRERLPTEMRHILALVEAHGRRWAPHMFGTAVGVVASMHLFAAVPGGVLLELDANPNPLRDELLQDPLRVEGGRLRLTDGPGLGIRLRPETIRRYAAA